MKNDIALIGAGHWGKNHLKNLVRLGAIHSVLEPDDGIAAQRLKEYPDVRFVNDESALLENPDIQGVVVAAPAALHYRLAKKYLEAGKDVLVEKPLALTVSEGRKLVEIAENQHRILMVGHILRYHPAVVRLKEFIDTGELGDIRYIYSNRLNIGKLRHEENVLWSFAPHDISLILMLMNGEEPESVHAQAGSYVKPGIYDTSLTSLDFKRGVKSHIFVSWLHPFKEQKLVVVGSEKMAVFDDVSDEKLFIYPHTIDLIDGQIPVAHKAESYTLDFEEKEPLKEELLHFIDCMETRHTPHTDGREGLAVLKILEEAERVLGIIEHQDDRRGPVRDRRRKNDDRA
ncbi:MAG: Gfo/Idh/MocA family oxidoreductase [bacterium]|nr:Gfo/Idh/MocA family oxidoreductase [bacterium]